jgi:hypothetical protein
MKEQSEFAQETRGIGLNGKRSGKQMRTIKANDDRVIAVTTVSGTIYKLGKPDSLGYRTVRRIMARREKGGSVIIAGAQDALKKREAQPANRIFFKGKLTEDPTVNKPMSIEIFGEERTLVSEPVANIEAD